MVPTNCLNDDSIGPSVQGYRNDFDFTFEFEEIFLSVVPNTIFLILSVWRIVVLCWRPSIVDGVRLRYYKLAGFFIYVALKLANLIFIVTTKTYIRALPITSFGMSFVAGLSMLGLSFLEHSRSSRPSFIIETFLIFTILLDVTLARSLLLSARTSDEMITAQLFISATAWKIILIPLESWQKRLWLRSWDPKEHSPEETSGLLSLTTFSWLLSLLTAGYKNVLALPDLFPLDKTLDRTPLERMQGNKHGLDRLLGAIFAVPLLLPVAPRIALIGLLFCQPLLMEALLNYLHEPATDTTSKRGYGLIGATILIYLGISTTTSLYWYFHERFIFWLASAVYQKTVHARVSNRNNSAALTLMSTDIERIRVGLFWANPVQAALASWLLYERLGAAFVVPLVIIALCITASTLLARYVRPRQLAWMKQIEKRVSQTANVISNMKHLRISGIQGPIEATIHALRLDELRVGGSFRQLLIFSLGIAHTPILLAPVITFAVASRNLNVTTIFTSISYLLLLAEPLSTLFQLFPHVITSFACLQRIQAFLLEKSPPDFRDRETILSPPGEKGPLIPLIVQITDGSFGWNENEMILKSINVAIPPGLTVVIGPVASGKSTFCKALLGETSIAQGRTVIGINDSLGIGYCEQVPILWNTSIKRNIVGYSMNVDEPRYAAVIEATMLAYDFELLPQGDQTKIGSDGVCLSGGQKQRISIARAVYSQCDLVVFDDVLSSLDTDTQEHVFQKVFSPTGMLQARGASIVLCTHVYRHLRLANHIIALAADGTLAEEGSFDHIINSSNSAIPGISNSSEPRIIQELKVGSISKLGSGEHILPHRKSPTASADEHDAETSARAIHEIAVFRFYFGTIGKLPLLSYAFFGLAYASLSSLSNIWLKYWSEDVSSARPVHSTPFYICFYALFQSLSLGSLMVVASLGLIIIIRVSGASLHKAVLRAVFAASLSFLTRVIVNLFSQDTTLLDGALPNSLNASSILLTILYCIQRFYLRTSRQLRLLDLEAKGPLYTSFMDAIKGAATIRAFRWTDSAIQQNNSLVNNSQRPIYLLRWLTFVLSVVVAVIAIVVVTLSTQLRSNAGFVGASMVSLMSFGKTLSNLVEQCTLLETSIARLKSFSDSTPQENTFQEESLGEAIIPPDSWPTRGLIEIKGVSASHVGKSSFVLLLLRLLDPLPSDSNKIFIDGIPLRNIDRSALRQRVIALPQDPVFFPDGMSIRTNLDPFEAATEAECQAALEVVQLWKYTCDKGGLDAPFRSDVLSEGQKQLFSLARAVLRRRVRTQKLLAAAGNVCINFAESAAGNSDLELLSKTESPQISQHCGGIIILDEFSSSVDTKTEQLMQKILLSEFEHYTVIMVSHRLDIAMEFDKVMVLNRGQLVEMGVPRELMEQDDSWFKHLWTIGAGSSQ
ncbi:LOW QUALITY PROTEIN: ABC transporter [Colletotrichum cereale]|nr:LOW QUALITY PROTEIN: ABC transporter [Colletotrichum cereale]